MRAVAELLNELVEARIVRGYAVFGAIAQMRYTEPVATLDVDVLVDLADGERFDSLTPIYRHCAARGYTPEGEAIRVGAWPVQFVPAYSQLLRAALHRAELADFDGCPLRVVDADHLAVIALDVGRAKDYARILALLEAGATTPARIAALAERHGLQSAWERFLVRYAS